MKAISVLLLTVVLEGFTEYGKSSECLIRKNAGTSFTSWTRNVTTDSEWLRVYFITDFMKDRLRDEFKISNKPETSILFECSTITLECDKIGSIDRISDNKFTLTLSLQGFVEPGVFYWNDNGRLSSCNFEIYYFSDTPACGEIQFRETVDTGNIAVIWKCHMNDVSPHPECSFDYRVGGDNFTEIIPPRKANKKETRLTGYRGTANYECILDLSFKRRSLKAHQFRIKFSVHFKNGDPAKDTKSVDSPFVGRTLLPNVTSLNVNTQSGNHLTVVFGAIAGITFVIGVIIGVYSHKVISCLCGRTRGHAIQDNQDLKLVSMRRKKEAAIHSASWTKDVSLPTASPLRLNISQTRSSPDITTAPAVDDEGYLTPSPRHSKRALPEPPGTARKPDSPDSQSSVATDKDGYLVVMAECDKNRQNSGSSPPPCANDLAKQQSLGSQRIPDPEDEREDDQTSDNIYQCLSPRTPHEYMYVTTPGQGKEHFIFTNEPTHSSHEDRMNSLRESTPLV